MGFRGWRVLILAPFFGLAFGTSVGCRALQNAPAPPAEQSRAIVETAVARTHDPVDSYQYERDLELLTDSFDFRALAASAAAPRDPGRFYFGGGMSMLPNIGISAHMGWTFARNSSAVWSLEAEGGWQFLDDESIISDGGPEAGDWLQAQLGVRVIFAPDRPRRVVLRGGAAWFQARGEPNIVQSPGDYFGGYLGVGFETSLSPTITVGPEISVMAGANNGNSEFGVVPQIAWRVSWWPGGHGFPVASDVGELYAGVHLSILPSVGGGFGFGQVFLVTDNATWSVEALATFQRLSDNFLLSEGDGRFAQLRGGIKIATAPSDTRHWTWRVGGVWMRNTGAVSVLPTEGDYVGAYFGVGYSVDLSQHVSTGPELTVFVVGLEGSSNLELVPQFTWHLTYRF